jgi:hypothetical protein
MMNTSRFGAIPGYSGYRQTTGLRTTRSELCDSPLASWQRHEIERPNNAASGDTKQRMIECVYTNF